MQARWTRMTRPAEDDDVVSSSMIYNILPYTPPVPLTTVYYYESYGVITGERYDAIERKALQSLIGWRGRGEER